MAIRNAQELIAWQLADAFKMEVYRLLRESPGASRDFQYRDQLTASAASVPMNIAEGFYRFRGGDFARFLNIALASLGEATLWLRDGIDRKHFVEGECAAALTLARRCRVATIRLKQSLKT